MSVEEPKKVSKVGLISLTILGILEPLLLIYFIVYLWPPQQAQVDGMLSNVLKTQAAAAKVNDPKAAAKAAEQEAAAAKEAAKNADAAKAEAEKAAADQAAAKKAADAKDEAAKAAATQAAAAQTEADRAAAAKATADKVAVDKATAAKAAVQRAAAAKSVAAKAPNDKVAADFAAAVKADALRAQAIEAEAAKAADDQAAAVKDATAKTEAAAAAAAKAETAAARAKAAAESANKVAQDAATKAEAAAAEADKFNEDDESAVGWRLTNETRLILLALLVGALGSYVGLATSFVAYAGNRKLGRSWLPWYLLRPFMGSAIALLFYFAIRGGFLSPESDVENINIFGILAIAGLAGLFSKRATAKLEEVFKSMFKTDDDKYLEDKLDKSKSPVIQALKPARWPAGVALAGFTITGRNFAETSTITFGPKEGLEPTERSATELKIDLSAADLEEADTIDVKVVNPEDEGGVSAAEKFTIESTEEES